MLKYCVNVGVNQERFYIPILIEVKLKEVEEEELARFHITYLEIYLAAFLSKKLFLIDCI